ncbi:MAG: spoIIE [Firmicutes bacterium]|nr:spoIIE [Bacillota bacterium]
MCSFLADGVGFFFLWVTWLDMQCMEIYVKYYYDIKGSETMPKGTIITLPGEMLPASRPLQQKPLVQRLHDCLSSCKSYLCLEQLINPDRLLLNAVAFFIGRVSIMGEIGPFGLALFAAVAQVSRAKAAVAAVLTTLGVLSTGRYYEGELYFFALMLYFGFVDKPAKMERRSWKVLLFVFGTLFLGEGLPMLWQDVTLYNLLQVIFNAAIGMLLVYIFLPGVTILACRNRSRQVSSEMLMCLVILLSAAIAGFGGITAFGYSVRNMVGSLVIMALAFSGAGLGTIVGVAVGLVVDLTNNNSVMVVSLYAVGGLLAGAFRSLGKFAVIAGFLLGCIIAVLCFGRMEEFYAVLTEAAVGAAVIMFIPARQLEMWANSLKESKIGADREADIVKNAAMKLAEISGMFGSLAAAGNTSGIVSAKVREEETTQLLTRVGEQVCGLCTKRTECWDNNFYRTYQTMLDALARFEQGDMENIKMPRILRESCIKHEELEKYILTVISSNYTQLYWKKKAAAARQAMNDQITAIAEVMGDLAREVKKEPPQEEEKAAAILEKAAFVGCQLETVKVSCIDGSFVVEAEKIPCKGNRECVNTVLPLVSAMLRKRMTIETKCGKACANSNCRISLRTAACYKVNTGIASAIKEPEKISGDACSVVKLGERRVALVLSDGMGSGVSAAGKSLLAVEFLKKLLVADFSVDVAVKTVNSLLLLQQSEESYATIDLVVIDLNVGEAEFLKVGAASSFIKRVGEVSVIKSATLPVGILQDVEIEQVKWTLAPGDIIVLVSDGVVDSPNSNSHGKSWVVNFLRRVTETDSQKIAEKILCQAREMSGGNCRDDMTVLVGKISEI